jgi:hypothetical protein
MSEADQLAAVLRSDRCAYCGELAEGNFSIHRDGFSEGPEVQLCDRCGGHTDPSLPEIWSRISQASTRHENS